MYNKENRHKNLRETMQKIDNILIDAHNRRMGYTKGQVDAFGTLKDSISNRLSSVEKSKVA